ncbi:hypothetical protein [Streptosporangium jomthongense]|uniref:Uncharacterized protein n=1 Tax=Streptosporangium jomthongense TaxID=1193683 RepID=A0ABV8F563_9ACTN
MIDDPVGTASWFDSDDSASAEISDHERLMIIGIAVAATLLLLAFSVYVWLDSGDLSGSLSFAGMALFVGGSIVSVNVLDSPAFRNRTRGLLALRLALRVGGRARRWQAEDWQAAVEASPNPVRYGLGLVRAALLMRLYDLGTLLLRAACWVLASNHRTWWPLGSVLAFAAVNVHLAQGWGSAFYTLPTIVAFHLGVEHLRRRWNIPRKRD